MCMCATHTHTHTHTHVPLLLNVPSSGQVEGRHLVGHHHSKQLDPSPVGLRFWTRVSEPIEYDPNVYVCIRVCVCVCVCVCAAV